MTTEEKAMAYAKAKIDSFGCNGVPCSTKDIQQMIAEGYVAGATKALSSQWKDPKVELPEDGEWVIIIAGEDSIQTAVWNEHFNCWDDDEGDDMKYEKDFVTMWMPMPAPPAKGGEHGL